MIDSDQTAAGSADAEGALLKTDGLIQMARTACPDEQDRFLAYLERGHPGDRTPQ